MPGQIKIGSYNTKLLEWQKHHLFCFLLLSHRLPQNLEARNNDSILFKFCHHGEGLAEWIVGRACWVDCPWVGVPEAGIYFQVVWFLGSHVSSPLAASTSTASPLGLKLLKPGSPGTVTPLHASWLSANWREAPRPFTALPGTGNASLCQMLLVKVVRGSPSFQEEIPEMGFELRLANRG